MRDVLSSFPPAYADHSAADHDADPFREGRQAVDLAQLAPADAHVPWEELASDVLDLFASIISSSADLAWAVLAHLDGRDINADELSLDLEPEELEQIQKEKEDLAHAKSLSSIAVSLLSHALVAAPISVRLVRSTLKLLTVLLPYDPDAVWQEVRSSNALIGSPGAIPYLSKVTSSASASTVSALLTQELGRASYSGLISLLDFHIALFSELQRSYSTASIEVLETKTNVLLRAFGWIFECVWPEYQSWRYLRLADRLEIGSKCTRLLEMALAERSWRAPLTPSPDSADGAGPASSLVEMAERNLVTHPSILGLAPLITCIGTGQQLLEALAEQAGRPTLSWQKSGSHPPCVSQRSLYHAGVSTLLPHCTISRRFRRKPRRRQCLPGSTRVCSRGSSSTTPSWPLAPCSAVRASRIGLSSLALPLPMCSSLHPRHQLICGSLDHRHPQVHR